MPPERLADGVRDKGEQRHSGAFRERMFAQSGEQIHRRGDVDGEELGHVRGGERARDHGRRGVLAHAGDRDAGVSGAGADGVCRGRARGGVDVGAGDQTVLTRTGHRFQVDAEPAGEHPHRRGRRLPFGSAIDVPPCGSGRRSGERPGTPLGSSGALGGRPVPDEVGRRGLVGVRFGSVGGGGRYDDLVARFRGELVPATGFSIGVSRLYAALKHLKRVDEGAALAPVVVLVMDRERIGDHQRLVSALRNAGVRAELYLGTSGMKAQMKYADRRGSPCVVIQGEEERARGEVQVKDLVQGARMAEAIDTREEWREARPAQVSVPEAEMVEAVKDVLARYRR